MAIPLPTAEQLFPAGGQITRNLEGLNALRKHFLENQYYGPNIESEIGHRNALTRGQNIENEYMPEKLRLANAFNTLQNQYYAPNIESEINSRNALTKRTNTMTPLEAEELKLKNENYPEYIKSQIKRNQLGGYAGMGTGSREQLFFESLVGKDNPQLKPDQYYEAANILANGGTVLSDGTKLNPLSPAARASLDRVVKSATTAPLITQSVRANQAEAELQELSKLAQPAAKPYATTYFGYSPKQIMDTFKTDDKSQTELGKFIAAQATQFEIAQLRNRLAGAQPSVGATEELMSASQQRVKDQYPKLSAKAREVANETINDWLTKALQARNETGINPSLIKQGAKQESKQEGAAGIPEDKKVHAYLEKVQPGYVLVEKEGRYIQVPKEKLKTAKELLYKEVKKNEK